MTPRQQLIEKLQGIITDNAKRLAETSVICKEKGEGYDELLHQFNILAKHIADITNW